MLSKIGIYFERSYNLTVEHYNLLLPLILVSTMMSTGPQLLLSLSSAPTELIGVGDMPKGMTLVALVFAALVIYVYVITKTHIAMLLQIQAISNGDLMPAGRAWKASKGKFWNYFGLSFLIGFSVSGIAMLAVVAYELISLMAAKVAVLALLISVGLYLLFTLALSPYVSVWQPEKGSYLRHGRAMLNEDWKLLLSSIAFIVFVIGIPTGVLLLSGVQIILVGDLTLGAVLVFLLGMFTTPLAWFFMFHIYQDLDNSLKARRKLTKLPVENRDN